LKIISPFHLKVAKAKHMKLTAFISAASFIFLSAFIMKKQNAEQQSLYNTKWMLKKIHIGKSSEEVNTNAFIQFHKEKNSAGGNGSCNSFGSSIAINGNKISFKDIFSTKMYCEGVQGTEDAFFKQLATVNRFEITGKELKLYHNKEVVLEFAGE